MTDQELLELAALAAGLKVCKDPFSGQWRNITGFSELRQIHDAPFWNPLTDDGDALRLAGKLKLNIMQGDFSVGVNDEAEIDDASFVPDESQRMYAIRESITRAAAAIGKAIQESEKQG